VQVLDRDERLADLLAIAKRAGKLTQLDRALRKAGGG
jgi:hypothetical protein